MPVAAGSVGDALGASVEALAAAGVDNPRLDAELLLEEATGLGRAALVADTDADVSAASARRFGETLRRRLRREPLAYVLGRKGFRRIELEVDSRVLVPRPETELLVEVAVEIAPERLLDVGTGSGAIALAVADELPGCAVTATDTSGPALDVARANAKRLGLASRVEFIVGTLPPESGGDRFDLVLANLPYVAERDWAGLEPEVNRWEPREALLAGPDGLDAYRSLLPSLSGRGSSPYAGSNATSTVATVVAVEVGEGQAGAVAELMSEVGFARTEARRDLAGIERAVIGYREAPK